MYYLQKDLPSQTHYKAEMWQIVGWTYFIILHLSLSSPEMKIISVILYFKEDTTKIQLKKFHLGWWSTMQMFTPSRDSRLRALRSSWEDALSKPDVGSSKIKNEGSMTISNPTFTRFLWPPEMPLFSTVPTKELLTAWSPRDSITLSTTRTLFGTDKSADNLQK